MRKKKQLLIILAYIKSQSWTKLTKVRLMDHLILKRILFQFAWKRMKPQKWCKKRKLPKKALSKMRLMNKKWCKRQKKMMTRNMRCRLPKKILKIKVWRSLSRLKSKARRMKRWSSKKQNKRLSLKMNVKLIMSLSWKKCSNKIARSLHLMNLISIKRSSNTLNLLIVNLMMTLI